MDSMESSNYYSPAGQWGGSAPNSEFGISVEERRLDSTEMHFLFSLEEFGYTEENSDRKLDLTLYKWI